MPKISVFLISFLVVCQFTWAQTAIKGSVVDNKSNETMPFVNIISNTGIGGTNTNINGIFSLELSNLNDSIYFSYIGYKKQVIPSSALNNGCVIRMEEEALNFNEFEFLAGENPAHRIIYKAQENRIKNNPLKNKQFSYKSYNKFYLTGTQEAMADSFIYRKNANGKIWVDSSKLNIQNTIKKQHFAIFESVTKRTRYSEQDDKEVVLGTKVSGLSQPNFAAVATDLQPFAFYENFVSLLDKNYINPISKGSTSKYLFILEDSIISNTDTVYIIRFQPRQHSNFDALKGVLYINTKHYAIQNVNAEPWHKSINNLKINQQYIYRDSTWFPEQLKFEFILESTSLCMKGTSFIDSVNFNPTEKNKNKSIVFTILPDANSKSDTFWTKSRNDTLSQIETKTYEVLDSIGAKNNLDALFETITEIALGNVPIGFINFELSRFYNYNLFEGHRVGVGIKTNRKLSNYFDFGGYIAYGFFDKGTKYGGNSSIYFNKNQRTKLQFTYKNDVVQPGYFSYLNDDLLGSSSTYRGFFSTTMDKTEQYKALFQFNVFNYVKMEFFGSQTTKMLNGSIAYLNENAVLNTESNPYISTFTANEIGTRIRFAFGEKFAQNGNRLLSLGTKYPIVWFNYLVGESKQISNNSRFVKLNARISYTFKLLGLGKINLSVEGDYRSDFLPFSEQSFSIGSFSRSIPLSAQNSFQTMRIFEFLNNKTAAAFINWNLGKIHFNKTDLVKPEFTLVQAAGIGSLNRNTINNFPFKTLSQGYYESGLIIDNIYRIVYVDAAYIGLGIGTFYRYGPNHLQNEWENIAIKLSASVEF